MKNRKAKLLKLCDTDIAQHCRPNQTLLDVARSPKGRRLIVLWEDADGTFRRSAAGVASRFELLGMLQHAISTE